ncbi:MAG TPA: heavy metal-associated domain-containing protein, partial [Patescibacteria group bacterium]|nr:heavy metal-associated domain-containing protein [Patescibacteria group bacterium]
MEKNTQTFFIRGMTCASCEVIIERKLKKIDGVSSVEVSKRLGKCTIITSPEKKVHKDDIARILADTEYRIVHETETTDLPFNWVHIIKIGTILLVVYFLMSAFGLFSFDTALGERLSYPTIFGIGLIASVSSCIAVVGGLVLTFTATVKRMNPSVSRWH